MTTDDREQSDGHSQLADRLFDPSSADIELELPPRVVHERPVEL